MKNINELLTAVANVHSTTEDDVRRDLRAYFDYLMEDPDFRSVWEQIPKDDGIDDVELLVGLMVGRFCADQSA